MGCVAVSIMRKSFVYISCGKNAAFQLCICAGCTQLPLNKFHLFIFHSTYGCAGRAKSGEQKMVSFSYAANYWDVGISIFFSCWLIVRQFFCHVFSITAFSNMRIETIYIKMSKFSRRIKINFVNCLKSIFVPLYCFCIDYF